jgi:hypothetical protein
MIFRRRSMQALRGRCARRSWRQSKRSRGEAHLRPGQCPLDRRSITPVPGGASLGRRVAFRLHSASRIGAPGLPGRSLDGGGAATCLSPALQRYCCVALASKRPAARGFRGWSHSRRACAVDAWVWAMRCRHILGHPRYPSLLHQLSIIEPWSAVVHTIARLVSLITNVRAA